MTNVRDLNIGHLLRNLLRFIHLNLKTSFNSVMVILVGSPIVYGLFLYMNAATSSMSVTKVMEKSPYIGIMTIVAFLDLIIGYSLWMHREDILQDRVTFRMIMSAILLQQIMVGNIFVSVAAAASLVFSKEVPLNKKSSKPKHVAPVVAMSIMFLLCFTMIMRVVA